MMVGVPASRSGKMERAKGAMTSGVCKGALQGSVTGIIKLQWIQICR